jgi:hypothetical protein
MDGPLEVAVVAAPGLGADPRTEERQGAPCDDGRYQPVEPLEPPYYASILVSACSLILI